jgi:transcriptional regulator with XRE-family HTH domain
MNPRMRREVAVAFGSVLRAARQCAGLSQERLAEMSDLDRTYPSLMERGLRQPTLSVLFLVAGAVGVDPGRLVTMTANRLRKEVPSRET